MIFPDHEWQYSSQLVAVANSQLLSVLVQAIDFVKTMKMMQLP